ncbi:bifunctional 4-hydroxy-2-oxoglutarate aldolase/2-dehydro-3-deoxy-phosphogluconate aldolase [Bacillota bacterium Meth-B3]|nr:bifunctional 4-hydroxy-2-oxoglutarate aldolase/2-dehydro-3-deoxy-phosphogluconate aldolase [Christensenellaceae bacterium]MEA5066260.1 bifunctional 4-hydroxy-2-oxoglutarate aldolase/2-dehydro-3-deoxy-phosphogluconate aldolase [Eubacteriales bacterium]MEA5069254.1 bifunctional 4-hydroxy-2-oxoglutarate aldolase/2-dehydro-3-deoxy-phosphogluconate aldolase [Christensenellaceae bacterium]
MVKDVMERVGKDRVIVIVRGLEPEHMLRLAEALHAGGMRLMEVTFNQARPETWKDTAAAIRAVGRHFDGEVLTGAGTVMDMEQLRMAADAGARYIVTPNTNPAIIRGIKDLGMAAFPGALTPSEIAAAHEAGADAVKVFPAGSLGPGYIKAVKAPLSHIPLMAVGGVSEKNAADFLRAGAIGVGVGGNIVNKEWIEAGEWDKITTLAKEYVKAVRV